MILQLNANGSFKSESRSSRQILYPGDVSHRRQARIEFLHNQMEGKWLLLEAPLDQEDKLVFFGKCVSVTSTLNLQPNGAKTRNVNEQWRFQIPLADIRRSAWRRGLP